MEKVKWTVKTQDPVFVREVTDKLGINEIIACLLYNRDFRNADDVNDFFDIDISRLISPMLMNDMDKAVVRIKKALENKEKITIYGDYDVDGITSVVVLYKYLTENGGTVSYYIPDRKEEGYGLNETALESITKDGTTLLITVDTGTTAVEEARKAKELGLDLIVTDHHECKSETPDCIAVVNPKRADSTYPYKELAGVGVVFKLVCALDGDVGSVFSRYGDLVSIGTVADIMSLRGENRILVSLGLESLRKHLSPGIKALVEASGKLRGGSVNTGVIAYQIAPRLNAAGRIGDPKTSVELLLCDDYRSACDLSAKLCDENRERQQKEAEILGDVERILAARGTEDRIIVVGSDNWHHGVIGIVASRIVEKYYKPCILICFDNGSAKGSARSVKGVSIFDLLCRVSGSLEKFGGHEMAAGLTLSRDKYDEFAQNIVKVANETITDSMLVPVIETEVELKPSDLSLDLVHMIQALEPFGTGNPIPVFLVRNLNVTDIYSVGAGKHLKVCLEKDGRTFQAMYFGMTPALSGISAGDSVDIVCSLSENVFNNTSSLLLNLKGIRCSGDTAEFNRKGEELDKSFAEGILTADMRIKRNEIVALYKYLLRQKNAQITSYNPFALARTARTSLPGFNYCKLMNCLRIYTELGITSFTETCGCVNVEFVDTSKKVDLQHSETWNRVGEN